MGVLRGKSTRSVWRLRLLDVRQLLWRIWHQLFEDELLGRSAELAYFFLLSIFPLLLFLTTLLGYLARENWQLGRELFSFVSTLSPSREVTTLLRDTLAEITLGRSSGKLSLGLAISLYAASNGVLAVGRTLNTAYGLRERRPWWWRRGEALCLVIAFAVMTVAALVLVFFGESIAEQVADALDLGPYFTPIWGMVQWAVVVFLAVFSFDLIFNFAPATRHDDRVWFTPGAVAGVMLWLAASSGFKVYLAQFGYYSRTYGSLGVVIVLLLWFYLTGAALLLGGELNSEIAKMQAEARAEREAAEEEEETELGGEEKTGAAGAVVEGAEPTERVEPSEPASPEPAPQDHPHPQPAVAERDA